MLAIGSIRCFEKKPDPKLPAFLRWVTIRLEGSDLNYGDPEEAVSLRHGLAVLLVTESTDVAQKLLAKLSRDSRTGLLIVLTFAKIAANEAPQAAAAIQLQLEATLDANRFNAELSRLIRSDLETQSRR